MHPPGCLYLLNFGTKRYRYLVPSRGLRTIDSAAVFYFLPAHTGAPILDGGGTDLAIEMRDAVRNIPDVATLPSGPL